MEIWKDIEGYEGLYQVSNLGHVKSLHYHGSPTVERVLQTSINNCGYETVCLCQGGYQEVCLVHRLVARAFIPNPDRLPQVNHKSDDKLKNDADNLEWCTQSYNARYGGLNERAAEKRCKPVKCIETGIEYPSLTVAAARNRVACSMMSIACRDPDKTAAGFHWKYI